jgi:hypothetical protein
MMNITTTRVSWEITSGGVIIVAAIQKIRKVI